MTTWKLFDDNAIAFLCAGALIVFGLMWKVPEANTLLSAYVGAIIGYIQRGKVDNVNK